MPTFSSLATVAGTLATAYVNNTVFSPDGNWLFGSPQSAPYAAVWAYDHPTLTLTRGTMSYTAPGQVIGTWHPSSNYLITGDTATPFIAVYSRSGSAFTKMGNPATLPLSVGRPAWSPDGNYVAMGSSTTPFLTVYSWASETLTKLANPASLPASSTSTSWVLWTPDSKYFVVTHSTSPYFSVYSVEGDVLTRLATPATLPAAAPGGVNWSPNGQYLAMAHSNSPFLTVYEKTGTGASATLTKIANPSSLPTGNGSNVTWADNGFLTVVLSVSPFIEPYTLSGGVLTKGTIEGSLPSSAVTPIWSPNGEYAMGVSGTTAGRGYYRSSPSTLALAVTITGGGGGASTPTWHPSSEAVAVGYSSSPWWKVYKVLSTLTPHQITM